MCSTVTCRREFLSSVSCAHASTRYVCRWPCRSNTLTTPQPSDAGTLSQRTDDHDLLVEIEDACHAIHVLQKYYNVKSFCDTVFGMILNRLAIAVLFAVLLPINGQQNTSHTSRNEKAAQNSEWTVPCTIEHEAAAPKCDWTQAKPEGYLKRLFSPENTPNIALVVIGFAGVLAAIGTLRKIEQQTKATEDAAIATQGSVQLAKAQSDLMIAKERARLDVKSGASLTAEKTLNLWSIKSSIRMRNIGSNRAFIVRFAAALITKDTAEDPKGESPLLSFPDRFLDPNDTPIEISLTEFPCDFEERKDISEFVDEVYRDTRTVRIVGFIEYETLGVNFRKHFGYTWHAFGNLGYLAALMDPPRTEEQRLSAGYWAIDPERDKPEYAITNQDDKQSKQPN